MPSPPSRRQLAWIAAIGHAPMLVLVAKRPLRPAVLRANLWAVGITLLATALLALTAPDLLPMLPAPQARWLVGGITFAIGHGSWSAWLARRVLIQRALE